ncbi:MAG: hypothetical protein J0L92_24865 [Deltaproteobacteria bacterium]|nr:hypothetical protein [Deltaproteobacteria bacterium]
MTTGAVYVSSAAAADYPPTVRITAGPVPSAELLSVVYVDPVVLSDGRPGPEAVVPHILKSIPVSSSMATLGLPRGGATTLLTGSASGDSVHFYGFECTQYGTGPASRPLMLGVAESLGDGSIEYVLVDHDATTGVPFVRYVQDVPRGPTPPSSRVAYGRVMPGISFGVDRRLPFLPARRVLMALVVGVEADPNQADLVVGFLSVDDSDVLFRETDRARIPRVRGDVTEVYESVPVAWHDRLNRWVVMLTVGDIWEGRFHLVDGAGRLFRNLDGRLPIASWWPEQFERSHSGNVLSINRRTGNVCFQTAHNTASGAVLLNNTFVNQWSDLYFDPEDPMQPADTFPALTRTIGGGRTNNRWCTGAVEDPYWEWQQGATGGSTLDGARVEDRDLSGRGSVLVVGERLGDEPAVSGIVTTSLLRAPVTPNLGTNFGVHRIVDAGRGRSAHVAAWSAPEGRVAVGVGFIQVRRAIA